jgi:hypothetical protein
MVKFLRCVKRDLNRDGPNSKMFLEGGLYRIIQDTEYSFQIVDELNRIRVVGKDFMKFSIHGGDVRNYNPTGYAYFEEIFTNW